MKLLSAGKNEVSYFWQDPDTDIWMRARLDSESPYATLDIKSTDDASQNAFMRSCVNYSYDMQAYIYSDARFNVSGESKEFAFLAVEKKAPYSIALYFAPREMLASGMVRYRECLKRLQDYRQDTGARLGYQPNGEFEEMEWPSWASYR